MTWYYALGNERQGPVDDATFDHLIAAGTITADTLVWKAGMADWQPLARVRPRTAPPVPPPPPPPPSGAIVPAASGDPATQPKFSSPAFGSPSAFGTPTPSAGGSGAGVGGGGSVGGGFAGAGGYAAGAGSYGAALPASPQESPEEAYARILGTRRSFEIGSVLGRAWTLVTENFGLTVATTAVVMICVAVSQAIPCIGFFLGLVVRPVLIGGLFAFFLKLIRGQNAEFGEPFNAFSTAFLPLFLQGLVSLVLSLLAMAPGLVVMFIGMTLAERAEGAGAAVILLGLLLTLPPAIYLTVSWLFSPALIVDKGYDFWPAMELSRKVTAKYFLPVFGLLVVNFLLMLGGMLALCLGIFVAAPVVFAAMTLAYEDLFGNS